MADLDTHPGGRSAAEIEDDVDRERQRLSGTIDALQAKASIGNLVDQVVKVVGENGGEAGRNLGRTVRDNPLPTLLTAVGMVWLMAEGGRPRPRWDDDDVDDYPDYPARHARRYPFVSAEVSGDVSAVGASSGLGDLPPAEGHASRNSEGGIGDRLADVSDAVSERAGDMADAVRGGLRDTADAMQDGGRAVARGARRASRGTVRAGRRAGDGLAAFVEDQPLVVGALALALGAALGGALPRTRTEDEAVGERSDRLKETVREVASTEGRKLQATAGAAAAAALDMADEAAAEVAARLPDSAEIVRKTEARVAEAAGHVRDAAEAEAEDQQLGTGKPPSGTGL